MLPASQAVRHSTCRLKLARLQDTKFLQDTTVLMFNAVCKTLIPVGHYLCPKELSFLREFSVLRNLVSYGNLVSYETQCPTGNQCPTVLNNKHGQCPMGIYCSTGNKSPTALNTCSVLREFTVLQPDSFLLPGQPQAPGKLSYCLASWEHPPRITVLQPGQPQAP